MFCNNLDILRLPVRPPRDPLGVGAVELARRSVIESMIVMYRLILFLVPPRGHELSSLNPSRMEKICPSRLMSSRFRNMPYIVGRVNSSSFG
jgi:hypothetical protein